MGLNLVFGRAFHLILMHLFCYIQCFEVNFQKNLVFLSKSCFSRISIDPIYFSINRNFALKFMWASAWFDWSNLILWLFQKHLFQKVFQLFFSLRLGKAAHHIFCCFLPQFLQGFPPSRPVWLFYPSFLFYFHDFLHFFMHLGDIFGPLYFWDFWWFKACFLKLIIGFWWDIGIFMFGID